MKTFSDYIIEQNEDKAWAVYDRDEIFINYFYNKDDAQAAADKMNNDTPSMKYHVKEMNRSELESK